MRYTSTFSDGIEKINAIIHNYMYNNNSIPRLNGSKEKNNRAA